MAVFLECAYPTRNGSWSDHYDRELGHHMDLDRSRGSVGCDRINHHNLRGELNRKAHICRLQNACSDRIIFRNDRSYSLDNEIYDVFTTLAFGFVGFIFMRFRFLGSHSLSRSCSGHSWRPAISRPYGSVTAPFVYCLMSLNRS